MPSGNSRPRVWDSLAQLRQAFLDAQHYEQEWADYEKKKSDTSSDKEKKGPPKSAQARSETRSFASIFRWKAPIVLAAEEGSDLETAVNLANEFHLKFVINHISHSQSVLDYVASLKVPVIVGPIYEAPKTDERYDAVYSLPAQLQKRGVQIAFASYDAHSSRNLPYQAGFAVVRLAIRRSFKSNHLKSGANLGSRE